MVCLFRDVFAIVATVTEQLTRKTLAVSWLCLLAIWHSRQQVSGAELEVSVSHEVVIACGTGHVGVHEGRGVVLLVMSVNPCLFVIGKEEYHICAPHLAAYAFRTKWACLLWKWLACCCSPLHFSPGCGWLVAAGDAGPDRRQIWIVARQHPGESMAEWFMEGAPPVSVNAEVLVLQSSLDFAICHSASGLLGSLSALSLLQ